MWGGKKGWQYFTEITKFPKKNQITGLPIRAGLPSSWQLRCCGKCTCFLDQVPWRKVLQAAKHQRYCSSWSNSEEQRWRKLQKNKEKRCEWENMAVAGVAVSGLGYMVLWTSEKHHLVLRTKLQASVGTNSYNWQFFTARYLLGQVQPSFDWDWQELLLSCIPHDMSLAFPA